MLSILRIERSCDSEEQEVQNPEKGAAKLCSRSDSRLLSELETQEDTPQSEDNNAQDVVAKVPEEEDADDVKKHDSMPLEDTPDKKNVAKPDVTSDQESEEEDQEDKPMAMEEDDSDDEESQLNEPMEDNHPDDGQPIPMDDDDEEPLALDNDEMQQAANQQQEEDVRSIQNSSVASSVDLTDFHDVGTWSEDEEAEIVVACADPF